MSLSEINQFSFKLGKTSIFVDQKAKFDDSIHLVLDDNIENKLESLVKENALKIMTERQKNVLLDIGAVNSIMWFQARDANRLVYKVIKHFTIYRRNKCDKCVKCGKDMSV